ncbi:unnamed protein product [Brassica oleracea]
MTIKKSSLMNFVLSDATSPYTRGKYLTLLPRNKLVPSWFQALWSSILIKTFQLWVQEEIINLMDVTH